MALPDAFEVMEGAAPTEGAAATARAAALDAPAAGRRDGEGGLEGGLDGVKYYALSHTTMQDVFLSFCSPPGEALGGR